MEPLAAFSAPTRAWFEAAFGAPTAIQRDTWPHIQAGDHVLAVAPTGSGKTLAAFLAAIDACTTPRERTGSRVLYVSPLKALAVDVERNLRGPLAGIALHAERLGRPPPDVTVALRTGDTAAAQRRAIHRRPPDILITTPESLFLMLTSRTREILADLDTIIVDEVHALTGTKRGAHLAISLARVDRLAGRSIQRIGLSATVNPVEEAARFLGGSRDVRIVTAHPDREWDLEVQVPVPDMTDLASTRSDPQETSQSIWPAVENRIADHIESTRSTIVFANSRRLAERLTARLNEIHAERTGTVAGGPPAGPPATVMAQSGASSGAPALLARAHHGSVSRDQRLQIEDDLKSGRLRAVVATSSLELGIDMGAVDLVIQVEAPPSVSSGLQRIGRSGHRVGGTSRAVLLPTFRSDLLASAAVSDRMRAGALESVHVLTNPLDVAAQHIVSMVSMDDWVVDDMWALLTSTAPYATLTRALFESVVEMLAGRYPSDSFAHLRPRLVWDRAGDILRGRPGAQGLAVTSGGTIPDRGLFAVHREGGGRVGELDEEMVYESRVGDRIALGASSWLITDITHDRVIVVPAPGAPGRLPFWRGDSLGRSAELGEEIGRLTRRLASIPSEDAHRWLGERGLDAPAADNLISYIGEQLAATGHAPSDRTILIERTRDELGDWRITILSPWGARVHAPWALLIRERLTERFGIDAPVFHGEEGIVARLPEPADAEALDDLDDCLFPDPQQVTEGVTRLIGSSALFAARFRECASRALLLPRARPGRRSPLWQQRQRSAQLLAIAAEHPTFPIVLEAVRECLQDVYDLPALVSLMSRVHDRRVRTVFVGLPTPSPFARSLLFGYVAQFLYEGDSPLAERRAAALSLDPTLLGELLGQADLRDLLEPDAIEQVERMLQHLTPERHPRHAEDAVDLLRVLGPLSPQAASERGIDPEWLVDLERQRRAFRTRIAGDDAWACVEDAARLRDALGAPLPPGIPLTHLAPVDDPMGDVISRYARTHGPFTSAELAAALGLGIRAVQDRLSGVRAAGRVLEGQFLPGHAGTQWCHPDVLRLIKRRSVAVLRHQMEPVGTPALALFLTRWQGALAPDSGGLRGPEGVLEALSSMAGLPVPLSALETSVLPARVPDYSPTMLDELTTSGQVVWTGSAALPGGDGWVCLAPADMAELLPRGDAPEARLPADILSMLASGGGWFLHDVVERVDPSHAHDPAAVARAMLDLLWAGLVSNDTLTPVRSRIIRGSTPRRPSTVGPRTRHGRPRIPVPVASPSSVGGDGADRARWTARSSASSRWLPRPADGSAGGRWFALTGERPDPTRMALAAAQAHLDHWGLVTRDAIASAKEPGGWTATYRVLSAFEEAGRVQRVYAVEGLGAAQFALPGVVDRLRASQKDLDGGHMPVVVLAAADPANAYGTAIPWPSSDVGAEGSGHRPSRSAGSHVVQVAGRPVIHVQRGGRSILTFSGEHPEPPRGSEQDTPVAIAARALRGAVSSGRVPPLNVTRINGEPALTGGTPASMRARDALVEAGFRETPSGLRARP